MKIQPMPDGWRLEVEGHPEAVFDFARRELAGVRAGTLPRYRDWARRVLTHLGYVSPAVSGVDPLESLRRALTDG